jgi:hypothetical protein
MAVPEEPRGQLGAPFSKQDVEHGGLVVAQIPEEDDQPYLLDATAERRLLWKCDINVLPCITLVFLLAFLDRTNIGMSFSAPPHNTVWFVLTR